MAEKKCQHCFCSFADNLYFIGQIFSLCLICFNFTFLDSYNSGCTQDLNYNYNLSPIYDIYITDEKTSESLKLGYLEEYSSDNLKIKSADIYKWKNKYINVKRGEKDDPIIFLEITNTPTIYNNIKYKTLQINEQTYLHYSNEKYNIYSKYQNYILNDLIISFREKPHSNKKKNNNICFTKECVLDEGICSYGNNYEQIDSDTSVNFINYNNIEINKKNSIDFYQPQKFYLYARGRLPNGKIEKLKMTKIFIFLYAIINILLRIIKLLFSCFLKIENKYCSFLYLIYIINSAINSAIISLIFFKISPLFSFNQSNSSFNYDYETNIDYYGDYMWFTILITEYCLLFISFFLNFKYFSKKSYDNHSREENNKINEKKKKKKEIENSIRIIENKNIEEKKRLKKEFDGIKIKIRKLKSEREKIFLYIFMKKKYTIIKIQYENIDNEIEQLKEKLIKRKEILEKFKNEYNIKKISEIYPSLFGNKLKINCIYLDENLNAEDDNCCSYEFFKLLKNSIEGLFFGIKRMEDFYYLDSQNNDKFEFILILSTNNVKQAQNFLETYSSKFSHIIIFTCAPEEFEDLKYVFKNLESIESDYGSLFEKLESLHYNYDENLIKNSKPYDLNLYSDYKNNNNIKKCHQELLNNCSIKKGIENVSKQELEEGLTQRQFYNFESFLDELKVVDDTINDENNDDNINEDENIENNNIIYSNKILEDENDGNHHSSKNKINFFGIKIQDSENRQLKLNVNTIKVEYLGEINKEHKEIIKNNLLNLYKKSEKLVELYTLDKGKFYKYLNLWLTKFNLNLYKRIAPITGKIMNNLYLKMEQQKTQIEIPEKLYRGLAIKKADIFLYKACEGDIFFYPSFTSTSLEQSVAKSFQLFNADFEYKNLEEKCLCEIKIYYNIEYNDVLQAANISKTSKFNESEILFPPFSFFKIKKVHFNSINETSEKYLEENEIYDGTEDHPFLIELDIIKRNFYLDYAFANEERIEYDKRNNRWILEKKEQIEQNNIIDIGILQKVEII